VDDIALYRNIYFSGARANCLVAGPARRVGPGNTTEREVEKHQYCQKARDSFHCTTIIEIVLEALRPCESVTVTDIVLAPGD